MERKRTVKLPDGRDVDVTEIGYRTSGEYWNEYLADDGTVIRVKLIATEVLRLDGQFDQEGNPVYIVKTTNVTNVSAPENLRRQP